MQTEVATEAVVESASDKNNKLRSTQEKDNSESNRPPSRATSPFRSEASALNRPKLGRLGTHLHRTGSKSAETPKTKKPDKMLTDTHVGQKSTLVSQTVQDNSHVYTKKQLAQVIGPSSVKSNGQTSQTAMETSPHPNEHDTASPPARQATSISSNKDNCAEAEDKSDRSLQQTTPPEQTALPTDSVWATPTSTHQEVTTAANDKGTQTRIPQQHTAVQTDNLPQAQS